MTHLERTEPRTLDRLEQGLQPPVELLALCPPRRARLLAVDELGVLRPEVARRDDVLELGRGDLEREGVVLLAFSSGEAVERQLEDERVGVAAVAADDERVALGREVEREGGPGGGQDGREGRVDEGGLGGLEAVPLAQAVQDGSGLVDGVGHGRVDDGPGEVVLARLRGELVLDGVEHLAAERDGGAEVYVCEESGWEAGAVVPREDEDGPRT